MVPREISIPVLSLRAGGKDIGATRSFVTRIYTRRFPFDLHCLLILKEGGKQGTNRRQFKFRLRSFGSTVKDRFSSLLFREYFPLLLFLFFDLQRAVHPWIIFGADFTSSFTILARSCARCVLSRYARDENRPVRFHFCFRAFLTSHDRWKYEHVLWRKYRECIFVRPCRVGFIVGEGSQSSKNFVARYLFFLSFSISIVSRIVHLSLEERVTKTIIVIPITREIK